MVVVYFKFAHGSLTTLTSTIQAMYILRNSEARSWNHCCREKAAIITFFCVCTRARVGEYMRMREGVGPRAQACACGRIVLLIQNATRMRRHWLRLLCLYHIFRIYLINGTIFGKTLPNIKCVFWLCLQILFETFLILRIIQRDIFINVKTSSCTVAVILVRFLMKLEFSRQTFEKRSNMKFYLNSSSENRVVPRRRTNGQTWRN